MTLTLLRDAPGDYSDPNFEDELVVQIGLAELVIALTDCSARRAFHLVRRRGKETPLDRLALAATRSETAAVARVGGEGL